MSKKILVPIDHTDESSWRGALPEALEQAGHSGAQLHAVAVVPEIQQLPNLPADYGTGMKAFAEKKLAEILKAHLPDNVPITQAVRQGTVYREILEEAKKIGADLIVMASHRPELKDYLIGPNAARVVRHAFCSVLVVRG